MILIYCQDWFCTRCYHIFFWIEAFYRFTFTLFSPTVDHPSSFEHHPRVFSSNLAHFYLSHYHHLLLLHVLHWFTSLDFHHLLEQLCLLIVTLNDCHFVCVVALLNEKKLSSDWEIFCNLWSSKIFLLNFLVYIFCNLLILYTFIFSLCFTLLGLCPIC